MNDRIRNPNGVDRRSVLAAAAAACVAQAVVSPGAWADSDDLPAKGDHLVTGDGDAKSPPLTVESVQVGGDIVQAIAVTSGGVAKNGSRFAKVILFRFDPKEIDDALKPMTVDGIIAFSAICTHQGCELSAWDPSDKKLTCFCHHSEFLPGKGGEVAHGPAVKTLPLLPLGKGDGGQLMVMDNFNAKPGPPQHA